VALHAPKPMRVNHFRPLSLTTFPSWT